MAYSLPGDFNSEMAFVRTVGTGTRPMTNITSSDAFGLPKAAITLLYACASSSIAWVNSA